MPTLRRVRRPRLELVRRPTERVPPSEALPRYLQHESATAELLARTQPWSTRSTLYVLTALLVLLVVFISVVKLDRVVTAPGHLAPIEGTLTVQPLDKAIISHVWVAVGDRVKKGPVARDLRPHLCPGGPDAVETEGGQLRGPSETGRG